MFRERSWGGAEDILFDTVKLKMKAAELSDFVWVYAESKLSDEPQDAAIGFTDARKTGVPEERRAFRRPFRGEGHDRGITDGRFRIADIRRRIGDCGRGP